jgi:DNA processing protein
MKPILTWPASKEKERAYLIALNSIEGLGRRRLLSLLNHFGSAEKAWKAKISELSQLPGWGPEAAESFAASREKIDPAGEYLRVKRMGVQTWALDDEAYPALLRQIPDPPPLLYVRGQPPPGDQWLIAIVGTRKATGYGRYAARKLAKELSSLGVGIVSGMARGIDTEAHLGALEVGGFTVAVLGCGIDVIYPPENASLYARIAERGLILSEFPPGTPPKPGHFPVRNRLISGISRGVVVVEAGHKSGALITADLALEQGREVFAVPGPINSSYSRGTNWLIKQGAKLVETAYDILEEYGLVLPTATTDQGCPGEVGPEDEKILRLLSGGPVAFDDLVRITGYNTVELAQRLSVLEVKGLVRQLPGNQYVISTDHNL